MQEAGRGGLASDGIDTLEQVRFAPRASGSNGCFTPMVHERQVHLLAEGWARGHNAVSVRLGGFFPVTCYHKFPGCPLICTSLAVNIQEAKADRWKRYTESLLRSGFPFRSDFRKRGVRSRTDRIGRVAESRTRCIRQARASRTHTSGLVYPAHRA